MSERYERLLDYLAGADDWVTAGQIADRLGVTTRSVRSYVTSVKQAAMPLEVIASSTSGYRLNRDAYAEFVAAVRASEKPPGSPRDRVHAIIRDLGEAADGVDIFDLAASMYVSESTVEADLRKVKMLVEDAGLELTRRGSRLRLDGGELGRRRLLSRLFRDQSARGFLDLEYIQREFGFPALGAFKDDLIQRLGATGYYVNEYSINNVLLHVAIAVDRVSKDRSIESVDAAPVPGGPPEVEEMLGQLVREHFDVGLGTRELGYLAILLTTRVLTPGQDESTEDVAAAYLREDDLASLRAIVALASDEYLVDLRDEDFIVRLGLHVRNLIARGHENAATHNPMTRSIKSSYPMIYELAVFIASQIQRRESIRINDDEIAYIALHVGSYLERQSRREERVTCAIVSPTYYDLHERLRERVEAVFGDDLQIDITITRTDVDWAALSSDIVLTTIPAPGARDTVVAVQPFLTDADLDAIRRAIATVRRHRRRMQLKDELLQYFDERLFFRDLKAADEASMIRALGSSMVALDIIDDSYVEGAIEREAMSSTAFTDTIAVPHAMSMSASHTAIAIVVTETPMQWGGNRVNVIALIAFSAEGRRAFQVVFDQLVEVFSDRDVVQRIVRKGVAFPSFIDELVRVMDE